MESKLTGEHDDILELRLLGLRDEGGEGSPILCTILTAHAYWRVMVHLIDYIIHHI